ncbi:MAG: pyruvate ferredoxin oxidoreductase [Candidatus Stahlbacteria bacterium]|nr:pyruvate ferredoxin oxidoreductase [Candidatus Stahlbacteria bacterium]
MASLKELAKNAGIFTAGHRACSGCGGAIVINQVMAVAGQKTIVAMPTGCMEVVSTIYPFTAWSVPYIHVAFENVSAVISGVEAAYRSFKRKGKITEKWNFIAIGGDGGTYDIGLQSLSGAVERQHKFLYVCYDNQAYMNTGIQRSSATPLGAHTTTSPTGTAIPGKLQSRKDLTEIMVAHGLPYVAQAIPSHWADLTRKVRAALDTQGPSFINILAPCPLGWRYPTNKTIDIARQAVETKFWPLYEVVNGEYKLSYQPRKEMAIIEWLKLQGRFEHLFEKKNELIDKLQDEINNKWAKLLDKCKK